MKDIDALAFFHFQAHPLLLHLYLEAEIDLPLRFDHKVEGPRLVAALRAQGFAAQFQTVQKSTTPNERL